MRFMTTKDRRIHRRLIEIAGGSPLLVEQAFRDVTRRATEPVKLEDVVRYILENRDAWHRDNVAHAEHSKTEETPA